MVRGLRERLPPAAGGGRRRRHRRLHLQQPLPAAPRLDATVETSIYLHPAHRRRGFGTALYTALFERLAQQPVHVAVAAVALPNDASLALHRKLGFAVVGTFNEYARKHGAWISSTWLQRRIQGA